MVRPRIMPYSSMHVLVWVTRALGAELPDGPVLAMLLVEEGDELVEGCAVVAFGVGAAGPRGRDYAVGYVAEVEAGFWVASARAGDDLAEEGRLGGSILFSSWVVLHTAFIRAAYSVRTMMALHYR